MSRLVEGEFDLGLIRLPIDEVPPEIVITTVMEQKILVALNKDHALAEKEKNPMRRAKERATGVVFKTGR